MKDKLNIIINIKKTITRLEKIVKNFSRNECVVRDNIKNEGYTLLRNGYLANLHDNSRYEYQLQMLVNIKMLDFYLNVSYKKKMISEKQYISIGKSLLDCFIMLKAWIKSEKI